MGNDKEAMENLTKLYTDCMNCTMGCSNVMMNIPNGIPPRGFYFKVVPIEILVVGKNPGHPLKDEQMLLKGKTGKELFEVNKKRQSELYSNILLNTEKSTTFHKNLFEYISVILNIPNNFNEIYQHIAHTNLLKCSTHNERQVLNSDIIDPCYNKYFLDEIKYLQPKVILALGKEVYNYLLKKRDQHKLPIVYIKHPSYYYKKVEKNEKLLNIKNSIQNILNK